jgi:DNA-binding XRE family transcriptional regulator
MVRTLDGYLQRSKRANSKEVSAARAVFDQAYGIACQVIELREKYQLSQVELAEKAGLPQAQISRIERGVVSPTGATLGKIAEALGADLRLVERSQPSSRRRAAS